MEYFLKSSAVIIIFYCCYKLFLQRETFFQYNRWFLLLGLVLATVLPLVVIPIYIEYIPTPINFVESVTVLPQVQNEVINSVTFFDVLFYLYLIGLTYFFGRVVLQFISLQSLLRKQTKIKKESFYFLETEKPIAPFSFFNRIVFNPEQYTKLELSHIIAHEKVHAKQLHSLDIIIIQIATVLFWFNPFIWWYKREIQQNLEFIADYEAQKEITCSKSYQTVLLKASLNQSELVLPNYFYQSLIKKRIIMLQKSKSKKSRLLKLTIVLPVLGMFLMSFNLEERYVAKTVVSEAETNVEDFIITSKSSDKEIEAIKTKLEAQTDGLKIKFSDVKRNNNGEIIKLSIETKLKGKSSYNRNVTYESKSNKPIELILLKIENGELVIEDTNQEMLMPVTSIGIVSEALKTPKRIESVGTIHMQNSGDTINIEFDSKDKKDVSFAYMIETNDTGGEKSKLIITEKGDKPLYLLDGEIVKKSEVNFDSENIASVNVLKGKSAKDIFGDLGKNGVMLITTKKHIEADKKLYILDGKEISLADLGNMYSKNNTSIIKVLNIEEGKNKYGEKGENGVVIVATKNLKNVEYSIDKIEYNDIKEKLYPIDKNSSDMIL